MTRAIMTLTLALALLPPRAHPAQRKPQSWIPLSCFDRDAGGFLEFRKNYACHNQILVGGRVVLDQVAMTDQYRRRKIPLSPSQRASNRFVAFLGCSFSYGEDVTDADDYPARVAQQTRHWAIYNYGLPGAGPNNVLEMLTHRDLAREIPQKRGKFVYLWIGDQAWRVVGSLSHPFVDVSPRYVLDSSGQPVLTGSFLKTQPIRYRIYHWLRRWDLGELLGFNIPPRVPDSALRLSVALFRSMQSLLARTKPGSEFYLVIYPQQGVPVADRAASFFHKAFAEGPIHVIDWNLDNPFRGIQNLRSLADGHPSPQQYRRMADAIIRELNLQ